MLMVLVGGSFCSASALSFLDYNGKNGMIKPKGNKNYCQQENIPVRCVPAAFPAPVGRGGLPTPPVGRPPPPWMQTPFSLDTDPPVGKPPFPSLGADPSPAMQKPFPWMQIPLWLCDLWCMLGSRPPSTLIMSPRNRMTDTCKNITLAQTSFVDGNHHWLVNLSSISPPPSTLFISDTTFTSFTL